MGYIDLKKLNLDELVGVVNLYPWFGGARKELCVRMSRMGGDCSETQFAEAAMHIASRGKLVKLMRGEKPTELADAEVDSLLKRYISEEVEDNAGSRSQRRVHVVGGDYFCFSSEGTKLFFPLGVDSCQYVLGCCLKYFASYLEVEYVD